MGIISFTDFEEDHLGTNLHCCSPHNSPIKPHLIFLHIDEIQESMREQVKDTETCMPKLQLHGNWDKFRLNPEKKRDGP